MIEGKRLTAATISRSENHLADYLSQSSCFCVLFIPSSLDRLSFPQACDDPGDAMS
jgi:hypothetical protein